MLNINKKEESKMKKTKNILSIIVAVLIFATMVMPVSAADNVESIVDYYNKEDESIGERELSNNNMTRGLFKDYNAYCHKEWIMDNGIGVGAMGWTDIDEKSDGSDRYHYSNIRVYLNDLYWESGRSWGYGRVSVSTGNVKQGALKSMKIFYGW